MVVALERFDEQVVNRKPDRPAPVRVAAEEMGVAFARRVIDTMFVIANAENIRPVFVDAGDGAQAVRREKLRFIEHIAQRTLQPFPRWNGEDAMLVMWTRVRESDA